MMNRRQLLNAAGGGLGALALADMLRDQKLLADDPAETNPMAPRPAHFPAKARSIIWLFMEGAPSGFDMFDKKPELDRNHGRRIPIDTFFGNPGPLMRSPFRFRQYGQCGAWVNDKYANVAQHIDDFAVIKSCYTESSNHVPALYQINTGIPRPGFPSAGSWVTYGLGSENRDLPGFVVLGNNQGVKGGSLNWGSGFLPAAYQGTLFRTEGAPVLNLNRPQTMTATDQRAQLDLMNRLNRGHLAAHPGEADLEARIESFELAYRMQTAGSELANLASETEGTRRLYGIDNPTSRSYGSKCLLARRLVERGVRFVQVYSDGEWDAHNDLLGNHTGHCAATDVPIAGLLTDLKRRGLFDSTLVVWGGEFGRMPVSEGNSGGRDHNPHAFVTCMAGAGIKGGVSYGESDEFGHRAVIDRVSVNDLHATMLHLMGVDHRRLTYLHNGRRFRLTDVAGNVLTRILS